MDRYKKLINAVYNGFMPVSQIKGTFIITVGLYLVFLVLHIKDNLNMQRAIPIENSQDGGSLLLNGTQYPVTYSKAVALVPFKIDSPVQFIFISSGDMGESIFSALLKIVAGLLLLKLLVQIDLNDPFNPAHYRLVNTLTGLGMLMIFTAYYKDFYTSQWFKQTYHYASGYSFSRGFGLFYLIPAIWMLRTITVFYRSAVNARREAELTI